MLKARVTEKQPKTVEGLITCIYDSWKNLNKESIINTFNSIYDRVDMIIEEEGSPIKY